MNTSVNKFFKKFSVIAVMLVMTVMLATGCSEHESEISKQQKAQAEEIEKYMAEMEAEGPDEKLPDADAPEVVVVSIYSLADGNKGLVMNMEDVPELDDWELTQKLKACNVLADTAQVIDYRLDEGVLEYSGAGDLTPRKAQAIINTFAENMEVDGQITLKADGKDILTSGYNADYENIDDSYTGGADDGDTSAAGPGVK